MSAWVTWSCRISPWLWWPRPGASPHSSTPYPRAWTRCPTGWIRCRRPPTSPRYRPPSTRSRWRTPTWRSSTARRPRRIPRTAPPVRTRTRTSSALFVETRARGSIMDNLRVKVSADPAGLRALRRRNAGAVCVSALPSGRRDSAARYRHRSAKSTHRSCTPQNSCIFSMLISRIPNFLVYIPLYAWTRTATAAATVLTSTFTLEIEKPFFTTFATYLTWPGPHLPHTDLTTNPPDLLLRIFNRIIRGNSSPFSIT